MSDQKKIVNPENTNRVIMGCEVEGDFTNVYFEDCTIKGGILTNCSLNWVTCAESVTLINCHIGQGVVLYNTVQD